MASFAGGISVFTERITVILPPIRSGKRVIAFALKGVTKYLSFIFFKSFETATATLIPLASNGYLESAV